MLRSTFAARAMTGGALGVAVALGAPAAADAATAPPADPGLVGKVLTPTQFPGWTVQAKPAVQPNTTESNGCSIPDPKGTTNVSTSLAVEKKSGHTSRVTSITEDVSELPSSAEAKKMYAASRALIATCLVKGADNLKGITSKTSAEVVRGSAVPGASHAYSVVITSAASGTVKGIKSRAAGASRLDVYLSGRYLVIVAAGRAAVTVDGRSVTTVIAGNDAYARALGTRAATAALALLKG